MNILGLTAVIMIPMVVLVGLMGAIGSETLSSIAMGIFIIAMLPFIWFSLALQVKRWHDRNKSGFWVFIGLVPYIGSIWQFVECGCLRGTDGPNRYGEDPLQGL